MGTKVCSKCGEEKSIGSFHKDKGSCKQCISKHKKKYYEENKEKIAERGKKHREENKDKIAERNKKYREENKEKIRKRNKKYNEENKEKKVEYDKKYYEENKEKVRKRVNKWRKENKEKSRKWSRNYQNHRLKTDPLYKLANTLKSRILIAIKKGYGKKAYRTQELLGCDIPTVREHLENLFVEGMSWDNHGDWHIDHILPCASFDLTDPEQQKQCFHYTNLQPLWAEDNLRKSDSISLDDLFE